MAQVFPNAVEFEGLLYYVKKGTFFIDLVDELFTGFRF